jgi:sperm-associated antigen 16 protein
MYSNKFDTALKEKMLMRLEKDRLNAKVESLESSLSQMNEEQSIGMEDGSQASPAKSMRPKDKAMLKMTNEPTTIPQKERTNPCLLEEYEATGSHLSNQKTFKGHLMGVTSLSYNPKKDIVATGSDDTTWKLWSVPNGDLIMSGEGHLDWVGGVEFHPKGNLLASASGDGTVKIWDFVNACCA